jgi:hypothetical protein
MTHLLKMNVEKIANPLNGETIVKTIEHASKRVAPVPQIFLSV